MAVGESCSLPMSAIAEPLDRITEISCRSALGHTMNKVERRKPSRRAGVWTLKLRRSSYSGGTSESRSAGTSRRRSDPEARPGSAVNKLVGMRTGTAHLGSCGIGGRSEYSSGAVARNDGAPQNEWTGAVRPESFVSNLSRSSTPARIAEAASGPQFFRLEPGTTQARRLDGQRAQRRDHSFSVLHRAGRRVLFSAGYYQC